MFGLSGKKRHNTGNVAAKNRKAIAKEIANRIQIWNHIREEIALLNLQNEKKLERQRVERKGGKE